MKQIINNPAKKPYLEEDIPTNFETLLGQRVDNRTVNIPRIIDMGKIHKHHFLVF